MDEDTFAISPTIPVFDDDKSPETKELLKIVATLLYIGKVRTALYSRPSDAWKVGNNFPYTEEYDLDEEIEHSSYKYKLLQFYNETLREYSRRYFEYGYTSLIQYSSGIEHKGNTYYFALSGGSMGIWPIHATTAHCILDIYSGTNDLTRRTEVEMHPDGARSEITIFQLNPDLVYFENDFPEYGPEHDEILLGIHYDD